MTKTVTMKYLSLFVLVFQNLLYILCMRHARSRTTEVFIPSSMVIMSECLKLLTCLCVLSITGDLKRTFRLLQRNPLDVSMTFIPAIIYVIQNRLLIAALSNLDAVTFQVAYQLKLFTTALFSMLILRKPLLKGTTKSLWQRNIELAFASIITGIPVQLLTDWNDITQKGYFYGFNWFVWVVVCLHSFGGLLVALVVKYANNILKAFACCVSIVLSCAISVIFLEMQLTSSFMIGALAVIVSSVLYAIFPPQVNV
ncbi:unnamed protein product [Heterobilharzia americana]|nr:unnamed protein product [Heterobilharzia americana]